MKLSSTAVLTTLLLSSVAIAQASEFHCTSATTGSIGEKFQAATQLLSESWDTSKLGCGAKTLVSIADQQSENLDFQLAALRANARLIYYLDRIVLYELGYLIVSYTTDVPKEKMINQPMIDLTAAQKEQVRLLKRAVEMGVENPEIHYFEALTIGPTTEAKPILEGVVKTDPPALDGAAHAMLGEILYAMPDIAGGDLDKAIEMMRVARQRAPDNPLYARMLAAWLLDIGENGESQSILASLLELEPATGDLQLTADQLRVAGDIAGRIPDDALVQQLYDRRSAVFKAHPYLQQRTVVVALGHFGDINPLEE